MLATVLGAQGLLMLDVLQDRSQALVLDNGSLIDMAHGIEELVG
jgi:hypothetical protein